MSEVASRPTASRGRGSGRGGRGGYTGRGGRRSNGDKPEQKATDTANGAFDDDDDVAELRKQYGDKIALVQELFTEWSDVDILFALQETDGDVNEASTRIASGVYLQRLVLAGPPVHNTPQFASEHHAYHLSSYWDSELTIFTHCSRCHFPVGRSL